MTPTDETQRDAGARQQWAEQPTELGWYWMNYRAGGEFVTIIIYFVPRATGGGCQQVEVRGIRYDLHQFRESRFLAAVTPPAPTREDASNV